VALAYALGDVFVIAVALTTLARTVPAAQRMVGWLVAGLGALAVSDLWYAASATSAAPARRMLYEVGLLALAGAARGGGLERQQEDNDVRVHESSPVLSLLPLLPVVLAIGYAVELVLENKGLRAGQLLPGIALTCSLILREYAGSRDKERLLEQVAVRERGLRAELRRDALTGVANRRGLEEALAAALLAQDPPHLTLAVIDLDDFKLVNDNHGHAVGDQVIVQVARRIRATVRSGDVVARLGGDEFAVLLAADEPETGGSVHERLSAALRAPIQVGSQTFQLSSSTGIVTTQRGDDVARLLADADGAMYLAKARKAQRHAVVRLDAAGRRDAALRSRLREEIAAPRLEQFHLQYQPVVDLATGAIRGFEALLRWRHPDHGPVRPDVFIPLAEQCGSIVPLGDFVLRTALEDLRALTAVAPGRRLSVGVNVSPRQLVDASFPVRVCSLLEDAGLAADQLVLEITEQAFETDLAGISASASTLAAAGVSIGVDDFGTGYSSLRYLQHLDLEVLKVDRSFVSELGCSPRAQHLVDGITALARRLDLQIVAEGIETLDQLRFLQRGNCEL
jgi:diguanylate cyclase (GGDEF)-like protein